VKTLADVRGKPFGFGDQASTSSHLAPRAHLLKNHQLNGETDYRPVHLGTHDAVARAVQAGQVPAGAKEAIRAAFLQMKDAEILKSFRIEAFAATDDKAYDILRDTAQILKLDLGRMK